MIPKKSKIIRNKWFYSIELILDIIIVIISYYYGFRLQQDILFTTILPSNVVVTLLYVGVVSLVLLLAFKINRCGEKSYSITIFYILLALPIVAFSSVLIDFIVKGVGIWRKTIFYALCFQIPSFLITKFIVIKIHKKIIKLKPSIIIGETLNHAASIALKLIDDNNNLYDIKHLARQDAINLYSYIDRFMQVFICSSCEKNIKTQIIEYCALNNIDCAITPNINDIVINSGRFNNANDILLFSMDIKLDIESRATKRIIDIFVSFIALIVLSPLMFIVTILIKCQGGSPIYSQKRLTKDNKEFTIYKFRTMIINAEKETGAVLASKDDNRITKLGKFLRASRIDEIPQLFNVLKGDMALVGPRHERPDLIEEISKQVPEFKYRTLVKAGVTGLAQTMGRYDTAFKDKLLFDLYYANNYSLLLDLKIMFYTLHILTRPSLTSGITNQGEDVNCLDILKEKGYEITEHEDYAGIKRN